MSQQSFDTEQQHRFWAALPKQLQDRFTEHFREHGTLDTVKGYAQLQKIHSRMESTDTFMEMVVASEKIPSRMEYTDTFMGAFGNPKEQQSKHLTVLREQKEDQMKEWNDYMKAMQGEGNNMGSDAKKRRWGLPAQVLVHRTSGNINIPEKKPFDMTYVGVPTGPPGPLDKVPAPCGGTKGVGRGKAWDMKDLQMALSASAAADEEEEDTPKSGKKDTKKKKPAEKGTPEAAKAAHIELFGEKWFTCIDCKGWYTELEAKAVKGVCTWCKEEGRYRKLDKWEDDNDRFRGSGSNHKPSIYNCSLCGKSMPVSSWLAYLHPNSFEFISRPDKFFDEAVTGKFERKFDAETDSIMACIFCKGVEDKVSYIKMKMDQKTGEPTGKYIPTNEWYRLSQPSKGRHDATRLQWLLDRAETPAVQHDLDGVSAKKVFNELRSNQDFRKAIDWNPRLGADVYLFYGCRPCSMHPLRSMDFYRTATVGGSGQLNVDITKPGFHSHAKCDWRTPCCAKLWSWSDESNSRLFVIGANPGSATFSLAKYAYIGSNHPQKKENTIDFLRACQVAKAMGNMEFTGENVLRVIAMIAKETERRLMHLPEVQEITTTDVTKMYMYGYSFRIVCEDERLSIPYIGKRIRVLNMNLAKTHPTVLPLPEFELLLSICAASLDIEAATPNGPAQSKIKKDFLWYDTNYQKAREAFGRLSVVCNHIEAPLKVAAADDDLEEM